MGDGNLVKVVEAIMKGLPKTVPKFIVISGDEDSMKYEVAIELLRKINIEYNGQSVGVEVHASKSTAYNPYQGYCRKRRSPRRYSVNLSFVMRNCGLN